MTICRPSCTRTYLLQTPYVFCLVRSPENLNMMLPVHSVVLILFATHFCVPIEATDYYFSSFCKPGSPGNLTVQTASSGSGWSGYIKPNTTFNSYSTGLDCTLVLKPPSGYGITIHVEDIDLRPDSWSCLDTITIQWSTGTYSTSSWFTDLTSTCSISYRPEYNNNGPVRIIFKTDSKLYPSTYGRDFFILYSTYNTRNPGAIAGGVIGAIVFIVLVVGIIMLCRRRRVVVRSTTTVCAPPSSMVYPHQTEPPPPYGYQQQPQVPQQTSYYTQPQP